MWVVWFHYGQGVTPEPLLPLAKIGYLGVTFFFVLSGFILTYTYVLPDSDGSFDRRSFAVARVARIVPLFLLSLLVSFPFFVSLRLPLDVGDLWIAVATLFAVHVWIPSALFAWNFPSWSIGSELFFYMLFPFLAIALWRLRTGSALMFYLSLLMLSIAPSLVAESRPGDVSERLGDVLVYNPLLHLQEFAAGVLAAMLFSRRNVLFERRVTQLILYLSPVVILALSFLLSNTSRIIVQSGLLAPFFALLILCLATSRPRTRLLTGRIPVLLGAASYAIYLFQAPVWDYMARIVPQGNQEPKETGFFLAYVVVLVTVSIVLHLRFEEPVRRQLRKAVRSHQAAPIVGLSPLSGQLAQSTAFVTTTQSANKARDGDNPELIKTRPLPAGSGAGEGTEPAENVENRLPGSDRISRRDASTRRL
jgi:peptidoglycan/LPS O-acetylase OafA/YrhL